MDKINKTQKALIISKNISIAITILAVIAFFYIISEKYSELKQEYRRSVYSELINSGMIHMNDINYSEEIEYNVAIAEHLNDNVEKLIDIYIKNDSSCFYLIDFNNVYESKAHDKYYDEWRSYYKNDKNKLDSLVNEKRLDARKEIIWNRIKNTAEKAIEKEQHKLDSLNNINNKKNNLLLDKKVENEIIISHFSVIYIFGGLIGASILPLLFWLVWLLLKIRINKLFEFEKNRKIELIKNHPKYGTEYITKHESLLDLEKSKIINESQFMEKNNNLIQEYYSPIMEEQRINEKNELELKLKTALELGNITQDEFEQKIGYQGAKTGEVDHPNPV